MPERENIKIIMPGQPGFNPPPALLTDQRFGEPLDSRGSHRIGGPSRDHHHAKLRLLDAFTAFVHKGQAVLILIIGLALGVFLTLLITDRTMIVGANTLERGAMIGSVFGKDATKDAPGDPRKLH